MVSRIEQTIPKEAISRPEVLEQEHLKPAQRVFMEKLDHVKSEHVREHLQDLYGKITAQAEKIGERLYLNDVLHYKKLVKEFLDVASKNSHHFSKQNFLDRRGRHRVYCIVKNVDRELDELTKEFLDQETDRIKVLKRLDDIRGLLLDIMM
ncbi:YaaR family protein [Anoxynatronum buryatiense]|uniref:DUF327 family protein n=1 Tax=Anoxynatronum buryatiense TaxID=489973 RepID=A0AA46AK45_9CLOT|nr:YaaR family protein [Anoxynatronum buryatiense]SMP67313.1 hypothetical protein SAMN06296020_11540 [Anoxynatronum buryatiense]